MTPTYTRRTTEEARRRAELSRREAKEYVERILKCPECGYMVGMAYSDSLGHLKIKCQKCKTVSVLNLAYFRRQKRYHGKRFPDTHIKRKR